MGVSRAEEAHSGHIPDHEQTVGKSYFRTEWLGSSCNFVKKDQLRSTFSGLLRKSEMRLNPHHLVSSWEGFIKGMISVILEDQGLKFSYTILEDMFCA